MASFVSPGVYVLERDFSDYAASVSSTTLGLLGTARNGPLNAPTFVATAEQFLERFGEPDVNQYGPLAALNFLRRGNQLWYVRVAREYEAGRGVLVSLGAPEPSDGRVYEVTLAPNHSIVVGNFVRISQTGKATSQNLKVTSVAGNVITFETPLIDSYDPGNASDSSVDAAGASAAAHAEVFGFSRHHGGVAPIIQFKARNPGDFANFGSRQGIEVIIEDGGQFANVDSQGNVITSEGGIPLQGVMPSAPSVDSKFDLIALTTANGVVIGQTRGVNHDSAVARITAVADSGGELALTLSSSAGFGVGDAIDITNTSVYDGSYIVQSVPTATNVVVSGYSGSITPGPETGFAESQDHHKFGTVYRATAVSADGSVWEPVGVLTKRVRVLYQGRQVEVFDNLIGYAPDSPNFWEVVIGSELAPVSNYVTVTYFGDDGEQPLSSYERVRHPNNPRLLLGLPTSVRVTDSGLAAQQTFDNGVGWNGDSPSAADYIGTATPDGTYKGLQHFRRTELYDVNVIAVPGISLPAVITELFDVLDYRHDALGIIDPPYGLTFQQAVDWHNGTGDWTGLHSAFATDKAATYWPWVQCYDPYTKRDLWQPPTCFMPGVFAYNDRVAEVWYAPAGIQRGKIPNALKVEKQLSQGERDLMYGPGNGNALNPILQFAQDGITVYGQRTLQRTATSLDRINVRRMVFELEKIVASSVRRLNFEMSDAVLWEQFISLIEPSLRMRRQRRALEWYQIVCDESTNPPERRNNNEVGAKIYLIPTKSAEKVVLDFTLLASGARVDEFIQADIDGATVNA